MNSQSNFLKLSGILLVSALLILSGLTGTAVQANRQATMAPTMSAGGSSGAATMAGTMDNSGMAATMAGTMGADSAYPPCPTSMSATMAATMDNSGAMSTMSATMSAGGSGAATMAATTSSGTGTGGSGSATMAATMAMAGTMAPMQNGPYAENNGCKLTATLAGSNEVPGPGAPNGKGTATVSITRPASGTGQICYQISVNGITLPASAAHIHMGAAGVAGPVVVPLTAPDAQGNASGCVSGVDRALIESILTNPAGFYVNVHTSDFPNGAARGQLSSASG